MKRENEDLKVIFIHACRLNRDGKQGIFFTEFSNSEMDDRKREQ